MSIKDKLFMRHYVQANEKICKIEKKLTWHCKPTLQKMEEQIAPKNYFRRSINRGHEKPALRFL